MTENNQDEELIRSAIRDVPDFPKPGILFRDITPMLADPKALNACVDAFAGQFAPLRPNKIVGIESRGFLFGTPLALRLDAGFVPARKPGKLPAKTARREYELEYGTDAIELHVDAIEAGDRVLVVDDLIATGGTAAATCQLVRELGGELVGAAFVIELSFLNGISKLDGIATYSILTY